MAIIDTLFKHLKIKFEQLQPFGFVQTDDVYIYRTTVLDGAFDMQVTITHTGSISAQLIDRDLNEPYTLHLAQGMVGAFVGRVKAEYEQVLTDIANACFEKEVFKTACAKAIIQYVHTTYQDKLEFLWPKTPQTAILRRKDNKKWYAAILVVDKAKLGLAGDGAVEVINVKMKTQDIENIIDGSGYFAGYHMNKKHWITICLDGSVPVKTISRHLDDSYQLATK